jgi:hypothetical protein
MRHVTLDMRSSLLDIQLTPNNRPPPSTAVIRMYIQPGDGLRRSQNDGQLQLCVPSVDIAGVTYRQLEPLSLGVDLVAAHLKDAASPAIGRALAVLRQIVQ